MDTQEPKLSSVIKRILSEMKYCSNSGSNQEGKPEHEETIFLYLLDEGFVEANNVDDLQPGQFVYQPNGSQRAPDFLVNNKGNLEKIEAKTTKGVCPKYNSGLPKEDTIYVFSSGKYNKTTVFYGDKVVSDKKRKLFDELHNEINKLINSYESKPEWQDNRGFCLYHRKDYQQQGGQKYVDYFKHSERHWCEQNVINRLSNREQ